MKVLDLQCAGGHAFEGWFGSEDDFRSQLERGLVECPMCGDHQITKMLSAPRLNLGHGKPPTTAAGEKPATPEAGSAPGPDASPEMAQMRAAWWRAAREAVKNTEDVGSRFAEEARRIHHGEAEDRAIRGQASGKEVRQLVEEGVSILPLPDALKETLQ
jgi:hypothetical protein